MLKSRGYNVKVVTYYDHPFYKHLLDEQNVKYECLGVNSKLCLPKLIRSIRDFKTGIVISFQTDPNSLACIASRICGVGLLVSERNTHQSATIKDKIIFQLYRLADYVIPNSYSEAKFISATFPFLNKKIVPITNFVDLHKFHLDSLIKANKRMVIMTAASVKASKNTKRYIEACIKALKMGCNIDVVWYGVNDRNTDIPEYVKYADECLKMIEENGVSDRIRLLHKRQDIENAYREADIFCLPSHFEGTPNVICEAMASGLPVMASNICDNSIFVQPNRNGWLFNQMDVDDMVNKLLEVSRIDSDILSVYGKESRKIVEEKCSEEVFVGKYIKLIESL